MPIKKNIEYCRKLAQLKNGQFLSNEYVNANTKYFWQCSSGHQWWAKYGDIQHGHWCPGCKRLNHINRITDSIENFKKKLQEKYNGVVSVQEKSYIDSHTKATFIDKDFGPWQAMPYSVLAGHCHPARGVQNRKKTNLNKYGCTHLMKDKDFRRKSAKAVNITRKVVYWETNEVLCLEGWEDLAAEYWNKQKTRYICQPKSFVMPDDRAYFPDFYLPDLDLWVEVKGRFFRDAKEKWDWFHKEYPNSELWDRNKLHSLGINTRRNTK